VVAASAALQCALSPAFVPGMKACVLENKNYLKAFFFSSNSSSSSSKWMCICFMLLTPCYS
jgi:hypothetical protein